MAYCVQLEAIVIAARRHLISVSATTASVAVDERGALFARGLLLGHYGRRCRVDQERVISCLLLRRRRRRRRRWRRLCDEVTPVVLVCCCRCLRARRREWKGGSRASRHGATATRVVMMNGRGGRGGYRRRRRQVHKGRSGRGRRWRQVMMIRSMHMLLLLLLLLKRKGLRRLRL